MKYLDGVYKTIHQVQEIAKAPENKKRFHWGFLAAVVLGIIWVLIFDFGSLFRAKASIQPIVAGQISSTNDFSSMQTPTFQIESAGIVGQKTNKSADNELVADQGKISAKVTSDINRNLTPTIASKDGSSDEFTVSIKQNQEFIPGKYTLSVELQNGNQKQNLTQDFTWGVLALNMDKSTYGVGEHVNFGAAVLNDRGDTLCDATLTITITHPKGVQTVLSTEDSRVKKSDSCGHNNVTNDADYTASYWPTDDEGIYTVDFLAQTKNGTHKIQENFEVKNDAPFTITYHDTAMRINPFTGATYQINMTFSANQDFTGEISEPVPASYIINDPKLVIASPEGAKQSIIGKIAASSAQGGTPRNDISWQDVSIKKGDSAEISISYLGPKVSPEFYLVGQLQVRGQSLSGDSPLLWTDPHQWQIASDAACLSQAGGGGSWNNLLSWSCGHVPTSSDTVEITSTQAITTDVDTADVQSVTIDGSASLDGSTHTINNAGSWTNSGTFTASTSTVKFDAAATGKTVTSGGSPFNTLQFNNANGGWTLQDNLSTSTLAVTAGNLDASSMTITISGTGTCFTRAGTFTYSTSKVSYTNGTSCTILAMTGTGGTNGYYNLDTNGVGVYTLGGATVVNNNLSVRAGTFSTSGSNYALSITGSYSNAGTFTANSSTVTFNATTGSKTLSGTLNGTSAFYKVVFNAGNGNNPTWTISDPMKVSAANATNTLTISNGTVTVGDGNGDSLESNGRIVIAGSASQAATLQTMSGLAAGSNVYIDVNNQAAPASCSNCYIAVGGAAGTDSGAVLKINANGILRLNTDNTNSDTCVLVGSTGKFQMLGSIDYTDQASTGATDTTLTDTTRSGTWTANSEANKYLHITSGYAKGMVYPITSNTTTVLTYTGDASASFTETVSGSGYSRKICTNSTSLITASLQFNGRYVYDETSSTYFLIITSTNADAVCGSSYDSFTVTAFPGAFASLGTGHAAHISDALQAGDHYEIEELAHMTAKSGTACSDTVNGTKVPYYYASAGSETSIQYGDVCNLGGNSATKYGLDFDTVNGTNSLEGVTIDHGWIHSNYIGAYFTGTVNNSSANSKGITNSLIYGATNYGIQYVSAKNNYLAASSIMQNATNGLYISGSTNNVFNAIYTAGNSSGLAFVSSSTNNIVSNSSFYGTRTGIQHVSTSNNIIMGCNVIGTVDLGGMELYGGANNNILIGNTVYDSYYGLFVTTGANTGNISINDTYGGGVGNTYDLQYYSPNAHKTYFYNVNMTSTNKVDSVSAANSAFVISKKDNGSAGVTKIWGAYSTPTATTESTIFSGTDSYDYASALWGKSATAHKYSGTGTEDTNLDYDLSSASLGSGPYAYRAIATAATTFEVYRINTSGAVVDTGTATVGSSYTDTNAGVNVTFKIDGGSPAAYVVGDTYVFTVFDASGDTNTTKTLTTQQSGDTITVTAATTMSFAGGSSNHSTLSAATGSFTFTNNGTVSGGYNDLTIPDTISGSGTFSMTGGSTVENRVAAAKNFGSTSGANNWTFDTLTLSDSAGSNYTITAATGGSGQIIASTALNVGKATDSNTTTFDDNANNRILAINGNVSITSKGTLLAPPSAVFSVGGNWTNAGTFTNESGTVTFNGTASGKTINTGGTGAGYDFYNLIVNGTNGVWSPLTNTLTVTNDLTVTSGTLDTSNGTASMTVNGNVACGASCGTINFTSTNTFTQSVGAAKNFGTSVAGSTNWAFYNLTFSSSSGSRTITTSSADTGTITIAATLTIGANTTLDAANRTWILSATGTPFTKTGTFTYNTSKVSYTNATSATILSLTGTGGTDGYYNLDTNGAGTYTLGGNVAVNGTLSITAGNLTASTFTITIGGTGAAFTNSGTFTYNTSKVSYTNGSSATVLSMTGTGGTNGYYNLDTNGAGTYTLGGNVAVNNVLSITAGNLTASSYTINLLGTGACFTNAGTFTYNTSKVSYTNATSATILALTGTGGTNGYYNLDTNGAGTYTLGGATVANNNLSITAGTLDVDNAHSYALTVGGNFTNAGAFTARSGTVTIAGSGTSTISGATTFKNFTCTTAGKTIQFQHQSAGAPVFTFTGTFTMTGTGGSHVNLQSDSAGTQWLPHFNNPQTTVTYTEVKDSGGDVGTSTVTNLSTSNNVSGNNTSVWIWNTAPNPPTTLVQKKVDNTVISAGGWINQTSVKYTALASDTDNPDTLYLCVEHKAHGVAFTNAEDSCGAGQAYAGSPVAVDVTIGSQTDQTQYHWQARVKDAAGVYSTWVDYGTDPAYGIDTITPHDGAVTDGANSGSLTALTGTISSFVFGASGVQYYEYAVGTTAGGTDIKGWTNNGASTSISAAGLNLQTSVTYYLTARATSNAALTSTAANSSGQMVLPTLTFTLGGNVVTFNNLNAGNSWTDQKSTSVHSVTNAASGYAVRVYDDGPLTSVVNPAWVIPDYAGTWGTPTVWAGSGFGYTSDDPTIQGSDKWVSATKYAHFITTLPGDIIMDHTDAVSGATGNADDTYNAYYKVTAPNAQTASTYQAIITYIITANF